MLELEAVTTSLSDIQVKQWRSVNIKETIHREATHMNDTFLLLPFNCA